MKSNITIGFLFITFCFSVILTGCLPRFNNPIGLKKDAIFDKDIYGLWEWTDTKKTSSEKYSKGTCFLLILPEEENTLRIYYYTFSQNKADSLLLVGHCSLIDGSAWLNLRLLADKDEFYLFKYKVKDDRLFINYLDGELINKAIKNRVLKGEVGEFSGLVSSSTNEIKDFFKTKYGQDMLSPKGIREFRRIALINQTKDRRWTGVKEQQPVRSKYSSGNKID